MPGTNVQPLAIIENSNGTYDVPVVGKRFAHAHEHHVRNTLNIALTSLAISHLSFVFGTSNFLHLDNLSDNFAYGEITAETLLTGCAESTT